MLKDVDNEKLLVFNKISSGEKNYRYFIGYFYNDHNVKPYHMMLPKISAYVKTYDRQTKWMHFLIGYNELLEKYNTIWGKFTACIKRILIANLSIKKKTKKNENKIPWR